MMNRILGDKILLGAAALLVVLVGIKGYSLLASEPSVDRRASLCGPGDFGPADDLPLSQKRSLERISHRDCARPPLNSLLKPVLRMRLDQLPGRLEWQHRAGEKLAPKAMVLLAGHFSATNRNAEAQRLAGRLEAELLAMASDKADVFFGAAESYYTIYHKYAEEPEKLIATHRRLASRFGEMLGNASTAGLYDAANALHNVGISHGRLNDRAAMIRVLEQLEGISRLPAAMIKAKNSPLVLTSMSTANLAAIKKQAGQDPQPYLKSLASQLAMADSPLASRVARLILDRNGMALPTGSATR